MSNLDKYLEMAKSQRPKDKKKMDIAKEDVIDPETGEVKVSKGQSQSSEHSIKRHTRKSKTLDKRRNDRSRRKLDTSVEKDNIRNVKTKKDDKDFAQVTLKKLIKENQDAIIEPAKELMKNGESVETASDLASDLDIKNIVSSSLGSKEFSKFVRICKENNMSWKELLREEIVDYTIKKLRK